MQIYELEVLKSGSEVGEKIGNPVLVTIGGDGKVASNQNSNPNAGAAKRPAGPVAKEDQVIIPYPVP